MRNIVVTIVMVCFFALAATIGTIVIGQGTFEGIVTEKPYETGLAWDEAERNRAELGWKVTLQTTEFKTGKSNLVIQIQDSKGKQLEHAAVNVTISRPSTDRYDKTYPVTVLPDGKYTTWIDLPVYGRWKTSVNISHLKRHAEFEYVINAKKDDK